MAGARDGRMRRPTTGLLALAALVVIVAVGVHLRLQDPLSTRIIGAEDPYSHVVFTKESLDEGAFGDSFHLGTTMYPPGLHALLGAIVPASGIDFHEFARFVPVVFGAIAIVGTYVLGARLGGHAAGLAAALVTAVMPEHVFRTDLLFPTALDLALLPAFLLSIILVWESAREERGFLPRCAQTWGAIVLFAVFAVPLTFTHPWVVPLFLGPAAVFLALRALRESVDARAALRSLVVPAALAVLAVAFSMAFRWDESDTGFADFFALLPGLRVLSTLDLPGPVLFLALCAALGAIAAGAVLLVGLVARHRGRVAGMTRLGLAAALALALVALAFFLGMRELPPDVSYVDMLGRAAIGLALLGVVLAVVRPSTLGDLALCISIPLFPLTAVNVFDSPFWPQRTVAYLCVGVALLAGVVGERIHNGALALLSARRPREHRTLGPAVLAASVLLLAGTVVAQPAPTYEWYRLYDDEHYDAFRHTVDLLAEDPEARIVTHDWQPALMVKALGDPNSVWYSPDFFKSESERRKVLDGIHGPAYVVVDKYLLKDAAKGKYDLGFLQGKKPIHETDDGKFRLYLLKEGDSE